MMNAGHMQAANAQTTAAAAEKQLTALPAVAAAAAAAIAQLGTVVPGDELAAGTAQQQGSAGVDADRSAQQAYAERAFHRFMAKLEGGADGQEHGSGSSRAKHRQSAGDTAAEPLTPAKQVSMLLREATSLDNLSQMYEGWSAWL